LENKKIVYLVLKNGTSPFKDWLSSLDLHHRVIVIRYLQRLANGGSKKSIKALKGGVFEIKIPSGPGLRVYFAETNNELILLILGGTKKTQTTDISTAKTYWRNYGK
jgi:putative addiction module killer protein